MDEPIERRTTSRALSEEAITARLERLPISRWHVKVRVIVGTATFFDGFDQFTIAFALPVLMSQWKITPTAIGALIAAGFAGQAIGALFFGWLAERIGRIRALTITIAIFGVLILICAAAQNYRQLFWLRFLAGIGLGGEVPVAAAYINEIAQSRGRGRFVLIYQWVFPVGVMISTLAGVWIVPRFGWRWLFVIGGLPAFAVFMMQRACSESPRWLAQRARLEEADRVMSQIEDLVSRGGAIALPPVLETSVAPFKAATRWTELFEGRYLSRTLVVWILWACTYMVAYGLGAWLPTLYRSVFKVSVQQALNYNLLNAVFGFVASLLCAFVIDRVGRRRGFAIAFMGVSVSLVIPWLLGAVQLLQIIMVASSAIFFMSTVTVGLFLYTPEIYPTRIRALGTAWASFWLRVASMIGPFAVGLILPRYGIAGVFLFFAIVAFVGCVTSVLGMIETAGRVLEEISP
jgi:MFS transporter, putative metabolite:H+ symporter